MSQHPQTSASSVASTAAGEPLVPAPAALYADDKALDVLGYIATLRRFIRPAAIVAALVLIAGLAFAFTRPDQYRAEAIVLLVPATVTTEAESTQQAAMLPMVARSYSQMAESDLVLDPVAKASGVEDLTAQDLAGSLEVGYPSNSLLLQFAYKADSSELANERVNAIVDSFVAKVPSFGPAQGSNVSLGAKVISRPAEEARPLPSTKLELAAVSVAAALAMGVLTAVALDLLIGRRQRRAAVTA